MSLIDKILELCSYDDEQEWFEFKENWFQPEELGEYVSALSNAAAFHYQEMAYFIWGVNDDTHEIVGTSFNQYRDYNKEPYQNYLARNLSPSINFSFEEVEINGKEWLHYLFRLQLKYLHHSVKHVLLESDLQKII